MNARLSCEGRNMKVNSILDAEMTLLELKVTKEDYELRTHYCNYRLLPCRCHNH